MGSTYESIAIFLFLTVTFFLILSLIVELNLVEPTLLMFALLLITGLIKRLIGNNSN